MLIRSVLASNPASAMLLEAWAWVGSRLAEYTFQDLQYTAVTVYSVTDTQINARQ
jgi:hypothetical protein